MRLPAFALSTLLILSACASAPSALQTCPRLPEMDKLPADVLQPSFTERTRSWLSGNPYELKPSASTSSHATPSTTGLGPK